MDDMAKFTKGRAYGLIESNPNQLPQIFIKEATVVRRSLIHEDAKGIPLNSNFGISDMMKGMEGRDAAAGVRHGADEQEAKPADRDADPCGQEQRPDPHALADGVGQVRRVHERRTTRGRPNGSACSCTAKFWAAGDPRRVAAADERGL